MATKVMRVCDVCDKPEAEPVKFGWGTAFYEADLCEEHGGELTRLMESLIPHARKAGAGAKTTTDSFAPPGRKAAATKTAAKKASPRRVATPVSTKAVREWAKNKGIEVNDKGRVPDALIVQFREAMEDA